MVLDDETIEWLPTTCPKIWRDQAGDKRTRSDERNTVLDYTTLAGNVLNTNLHPKPKLKHYI